MDVLTVSSLGYTGKFIFFCLTKQSTHNQPNNIYALNVLPKFNVPLENTLLKSDCLRMPLCKNFSLLFIKIVEWKVSVSYDTIHNWLHLYIYAYFSL